MRLLYSRQPPGPNMPELLFEIWGDGPKEGGGSMFVVHPQNDEVRRLTMPTAVLLHSFTAKSSFEAFRHKNDWFGYDAWQPPEDLADQEFTDQEIVDHCAYLRGRSGE